MVNSTVNGWAAAKVSLQPCSRYSYHYFNTSLSSSSAKWTTQWSKTKKNLSLRRFHFSEDHCMFAKLWSFSSFLIRFLKKIPPSKISTSFLFCVCYKIGHEVTYQVDFSAKWKKVKRTYQTLYLLGKITPHTFLYCWKPGCQSRDLPFTSSPTPSRPRIWKTKSLPSVLTL